MLVLENTRFTLPLWDVDRRDNTALIYHICLLHIISSNGKLSWIREKVAMVNIILQIKSFNKQKIFKQMERKSNNSRLLRFFYLAVHQLDIAPPRNFLQLQ